MGEGSDLKALEKGAWTSYFQDGLWEIVIGTILLIGVLSSALDLYGVEDTTRITIYVPLMVALPPLILVLGKRYITVPRLGVAKFGRHREVNGIKMMLAIAATVVITLVIWGLGAIFQGGLRGPAGMLLVTFIVLAIFCLIGYYLDYRGFYLIAALVALPIPLTWLLEQRVAFDYFDVAANGIPAAILLAIGLAALVRFMRRYDVPREAPDAS